VSGAGRVRSGGAATFAVAVLLAVPLTALAAGAPSSAPARVVASPIDGLLPTVEPLPSLPPAPTLAALPSIPPIPTLDPLPTLEPLPVLESLPVVGPLPSLLPDATVEPQPAVGALPSVIPLPITPVGSMPDPMPTAAAGVAPAPEASLAAEATADAAESGREADVTSEAGGSATQAAGLARAWAPDGFLPDRSMSNEAATVRPAVGTLAARRGVVARAATESGPSALSAAMASVLAASVVVAGLGVAHLLGIGLGTLGGACSAFTAALDRRARRLVSGLPMGGSVPEGAAPGPLIADADDPILVAMDLAPLAGAGRAERS
jgi:hypothetical protein